MTSKLSSYAPWIALQLTPGVGITTFLRLIDYFGSAEAVWDAPANIFLQLSWARPGTRKALAKGPDNDAVCRVLETLEGIGAWVMTIHDRDYPPLLARTANPPPLLYGLGRRDALSKDLVAIVGARQATTYGLKVAKELAKGLSSHGVGVSSGLAIGIDTAAHQGALEAGGVTVAVKGCGLDVCYPKRNTSLSRRICGKGAVISEFLPGTPPEAQNFPIRNRIVSGLSQGVVVVEAGPKSGALITAACALDQGREVMAVPGSIYSYKSSGTHYLLKMGASLVENVQDVLEELGLGPGHEAGRGSMRHFTGVTKRSAYSSLEEQIVLSKLEPYPQHIDEIAQACGLPVGKVSSLLFELEIKDLVASLPGQMYQLK